MPHSFPTRRSSDLIVLQLPARRAPRLTIERHPRLLRRPAAFLEVARRAGGGDILPRRAPAQPARHDMIESQILARSAILAREAVAQEQVEARERRMQIGRASGRERGCTYV